ncbi:MAG: hypothetical protein KJO63_02165 [Maribacter sp.]|nr:hypothetical protein [Maribacter sp.]
MKKKLLFSIILICFNFSCQKEHQKELVSPTLSFEKINYYKYPTSDNAKPFQFRLTYYNQDGLPHRWMELDSLGRITTDYIYEYDNNWKQTGARYREESAVDFSIENVRFENDSTKITEWIDSIGQVYYRMIDNLNEDKKTYRAAFIGDKLHGYDSTFYTRDGLEERIFFTNTKGKVFNDRIFNYDSINQKGDWVKRKKIMRDTIRELHTREVYYDNNFVSDNGKFYEGIVSTGELSENVISFSADEAVMFLTRTSDWTNQTAFVAQLKNGIYTETNPIKELGKIYNGAISPKGDKIIYSIRKEDSTAIWLISKVNGQWSNKINLTEASKIEGGYFYWFSDTEIYFYQDKNNGDIVLGEINKGTLSITDSLNNLNTKEGTEFSPFVDREKRFIIFSRYEEGIVSNQGFFISYNQGNFNTPNWSHPKKIPMLPYGWSAYIINDGTQFIYTNGEDIYSVPLKDLKLINN